MGVWARFPGKELTHIMKNQEARMQAHALGEKTYSTGKPCKYGHMAKRYVVNGGCVECTNGLRLPTQIASDLQPFQLLPVQVPRGLDAPTLDGINDYIHACIVSWVDQMKLMTPERQQAYAGLLKARVNARQLRHAAVPAPVAAALKSERTQRFEGFLAALAIMTGAALDKATDVQRQPGEPDNNFRARIKSKTLQNYEAGIG